jgi:hypothetical protein
MLNDCTDVIVKFDSSSEFVKWFHHGLKKWKIRLYPGHLLRKFDDLRRSYELTELTPNKYIIKMGRIGKRDRRGLPAPLPILQ